MRIMCCCSNIQLRNFNQGNNLFVNSSDFIGYQKFIQSACPTTKYTSCYPRAPNQNNSSNYISALKASVIYPSNCRTCKCICGVVGKYK